LDTDEVGRLELAACLSATVVAQISRVPPPPTFQDLVKDETEFFAMGASPASAHDPAHGRSYAPYVEFEE
jgi:hypothetical protein